MKRAWWSAFAVSAVMLGMAHGPRSWATEPDLPGEKQIQSSEAGDPAPRRFSIELGITQKGVTLKLDAGLATPEPTVAIDAMCPNIVPAYVQVLVNRLMMSRLGRLAFDRIGGLEDRLGDAEESSELDPEALFHEMRDRTIPLGLAQQATY